MIAFENVDSSSRFELIPSKIKMCYKVVLNFHKEFSVFSSFKEKGNDRLLQNIVFKHEEEVVINNTIRILEGYVISTNTQEMDGEIKAEYAREMYLHSPLMFPAIKQLAIKWWDEYGFVIHLADLKAVDLIDNSIALDLDEEPFREVVPNLLSCKL
nr:hypothetical protein [Tanacetum cinerariifolium]